MKQQGKSQGENKVKRIIITIVISLIVFSGGGYWLGYLMGSHSVLPPINQDMSIYDSLYTSGKQLGTKEGGIASYNYWYQKGRQEQIDFMVNHTKGGINWVK